MVKFFLDLKQTQKTPSETRLAQMYPLYGGMTGRLQDQGCTGLKKTANLALASKTLAITGL
jgi:hypothetical protein